MSDGSGTPLPIASVRAQDLARSIERYCDRVEIVGSIRRRKTIVSDIELLVAPKGGVADLFESAVPDVGPLRAALGRIGYVLKSGDRYVQIELGRGQPTAMKADVFMVHPPASWGALMVIRTGPASFSRYCVTRLRSVGKRSHAGAVWMPAEHADPYVGTRTSCLIHERPFVKVPTPTEERFFEVCRMEYVPPELRDGATAERFAK